ncbi:protein SIP5-like [Iris pallida]|uniref:Protein SIP5-like n=1 Tax=Iris pallida TaxID=29817 RepID=A0AAX6H050_IRIPA|nr:protein SIP5-like [Iris pallida]
MGNKMCGGRRRRPVEERLTRPQRIRRQASDVDYRRLRRLIVAEKLAPCFDAADELPSSGADLEECPICFFYYPSLNRSRCCAKGICTECFLQMKPSCVTRSAQCPFCKTSCYAVEYRGVRTEEEKDLERQEEQKVIEAKRRMQYESQTEECVVWAGEPQSLVELLRPVDVEGPSSCDCVGEVDGDVQVECSEMQESTDLGVSPDPNTCNTRHEELDVDLEEVMVMEAIWRSLQDSRLRQSGSRGIGSPSEGSNPHGRALQPGRRGEHLSFCSLAEGVAVAIARLAKHSGVRLRISEPGCETIQTGSCTFEPNSPQPETEFSASYGLRIGAIIGETIVSGTEVPISMGNALPLSAV